MDVSISRTYLFAPLAMGLMIWLLPSHSLAQKPEQINALEEMTYMPYDLPILVDTTGLMDFNSVRGLKPGQFKKYPGYQNADFVPGAAYWIRLPVDIQVGSEKSWFIEIYDQTIDHLEVWVPSKDGEFSLIRTGDLVPFDEKSVRHKNFEVPVTASDSASTYYFRIKSHEFADLRIGLRSVNRFIYYALNEYIIFGMFYGMIFIISLYNLLVYLAIREQKNLFYVFYILSVGGYALALDGIGYQYLWPNRPEWNNYATGVFLYLLVIWALLFSRQFLNTRTRTPQLDNVLLSILALRTCLFVAEVLFWPDMLSYRNQEAATFFTVFASGIYMWRKGYQPARFFVLAYGVLMAGFVIRALVSFNLLPFTLFSHYSLHLAFVVEMLLLTFALGDRIRILKAMRDLAHRRITRQQETTLQLKDNLNRELEETVARRTSELDQKNRELEESNRQLTAQAEKINRINSILDLDNWKLKSRIREVLNERLHEEVMTYEEFQTLYPDSNSCYRLLARMKWEQGFYCRKCANHKAITRGEGMGSNRHARRCSRCGQSESITAFTLYHSLKFPIEKAFYLTYLTVVSGKENQTLEATAETLGLSIQTIWSFRKKVQERMVTSRKKGPLHWESLILDAPVLHAPEHNLGTENQLIENHSPSPSPADSVQ